MSTITINGAALTGQALQAMRAAGLPDGDYWYDPACGAWGTIGGPCAGFVAPGVPTAQPLPPDASGGQTQVFINGRALHPLDLQRLAFVCPLPAGRYTLDAAGTLAREGGMPLANLRAAMQPPQGSWSHTGGVAEDAVIAIPRCALHRITRGSFSREDAAWSAAYGPRTSGLHRSASRSSFDASIGLVALLATRRPREKSARASSTTPPVA